MVKLQLPAFQFFALFRFSLAHFALRHRCHFPGHYSNAGGIKNVVAWTRVSSREQREGYSLDAQLRAIRDKAARDNLKIVKEFSVAESAKRGVERTEFKKMLTWVRQNAKKEEIRGIVFHKLDRACRNMRDAVQLQELEDQCGVKPYFVDQQFGNGAAGQLSFNILASVAQFYSDNLHDEVLKGMSEKAEQGWLPANAPFGYVNDSEDKDEPIKPHPEKSVTVRRIFELYVRGNTTFEALAEQLHREGHAYWESRPKFIRTTLSYILNNRFYIGEIMWHGRVFQGKHKPLVDRVAFEACQSILNGRNRRTGNPDHPLAGGLFRCKYCGQGITGERVRRKLQDGTVNVHNYYRCANNNPGVDHPRVRWKAEDLESAIQSEIEKLKLPSKKSTDWCRDMVRKSMSDEREYRKASLKVLRKRETELETQQDRLLTAYLSGAVEERLFQSRNEAFRRDLALLQEEMAREAVQNQNHGEMAVKLFDFTQKAADLWRGSNNDVRREILDIVCLNREISDTSLCLTWRTVFEKFAKQPKNRDGRGDRIYPVLIVTARCDQIQTLNAHRRVG